MALSTEDAATLAALKAARLRLMTGAAVEKVQSGGRLVEYTPANAGKLQSEIDALEAAAATSSGRLRRRGALRVFIA